MALGKAEGLRCAASFVTAAYCEYASFLRFCAPCIWIFFLYRLVPTFYETIKGDF